jgi:hypothetical protein
MTLGEDRAALGRWLRDGDPLDPRLERWLSVIRREGLAGLVYRRLADTDALRRVPAAVREALVEERRRTVARMLLLVDELGWLLDTCRAEELPVVPLRGPALADRLWGDPTVRPAGDLDLLVRKADLPRLAALLATRGYRELSHRPGFAQRFSYTLTFVRERYGWLVVEPHWSLAYPPFVTGVWARAHRVRLLGREVLWLGPEDLLLHLCLHGLHPDQGAPLLWWWELDRLVRVEGPRVDWDRLWSTARSAGVALATRSALRRVSELFGTPIPWGSEAEPGPPPPAGRLHRLVARPQLHGREELALLVSLPRLRDRLAYAAGLLVPSPGYVMLAEGLSSPLELPDAYLRRWARLARRGLGTVLGGLLRPGPG